MGKKTKFARRSRGSLWYVPFTDPMFYSGLALDEALDSLVPDGLPNALQDTRFLRPVIRVPIESDEAAARREARERARQRRARQRRARKEARERWTAFCLAWARIGDAVERCRERDARRARAWLAMWGEVGDALSRGHGPDSVWRRERDGTISVVATGDRPELVEQLAVIVRAFKRSDPRARIAVAALRGALSDLAGEDCLFGAPTCADLFYSCDQEYWCLACQAEWICLA